MKFYIDFDSTLYNTRAFIKSLLDAITNAIISQNKSLNREDVLAEAKDLFTSDKIYNVEKLCRFFAEKYNLDFDPIFSSAKFIINNGTGFVYPDTIPFLEKLKSENNELVILTFAQTGNTDEQMLKIKGSKLDKFFDDIIITTVPKWTLELDYKNSFFIDDNPKELSGLYKNNPYKIVRIKREDTKYSLAPLADGVEMEEYKNLTDVIY